ncbi:MAG: hypothetical protein RL291_1682 [Pseudomonadota bacterium]
MAPLQFRSRGWLGRFGSGAHPPPQGWRFFVLAALLSLIVVTCGLAIAVLGQRLVREAPLLWFGVDGQATVTAADLRRSGSFRDGAPKYWLVVDYRFDVGGVGYRGQTSRNDLRDPPDFKPGDAIAIRYDPRAPTNSVADHNLAIDVYALLLFLPFLAIVGVLFPLIYLWDMIAAYRNRRSLERS